MRKRPAGFLLAVAALTLMVSAAVLANNPIAVNSGGNATRWATPVNITYNTDGGTLGALSNALANTLTADAFGAWSGVATASVAAVKGATLLTGDGDVNTIGEYNAMACVGLNPIVYDHDGSLTDILMGVGAKNNVLGFAGPCAIQPAPAFPPGPDTIVGGRATMNGFLITSAAGLAYSRSKGVFIHELGHFLGIGHSQVNLDCLNNPASCPSNTPGGDLFGVPTMFPILLNQTEVANTSYSETLTVDDQSAISTLYPNADSSFTNNFGTIAGQVLFSDLTNEAQGINVIARRVGDPRVTAISNTSGMFASASSNSSAGSSDSSLRGDFMIPGLPPGTYTLEIESINPSFIGGSRVGALSGSTGRSENIPIPSPAVAECFGGPESNTDTPATCQNIVVAAGNVLNGNDFVLNETFATLDATDAVARNENVSDATPIGAGTFSRSISGPDGNDQDYYALSVTSGVPIFIEIKSRRLNPVRYLDSIVEIKSGAGGPPLTTCRIGDATGAYDQVCLNDDYTPTGGSLTRDSKLQFMPGSTGVVILSVEDRFGDARPDFLYDLIIDGVAPVPTVTFSPTAENFSSQAINTTSFPRDIEVVNNGAVDVTLNSFDRLGANPNDFALVAPNAGTPCNLAGGTVLAAGGSCFFGLTFSPTTVGAYSATIRVNHSGGDSPSDFSVTGTGSGGPPNDLRANAITTDPSPFTDFQDTTLATQSVDDITLGAGLPAFSCNVAVPPANNKSIWYKFTTPAAGLGSITATPLGGPLGSYDVAVAIATVPGGVFTPQACANSNPSGIPETIGLNVSAGLELYFMVAAVNGDGGQTLINFTFTPNGIDADLSVTKTDNDLVFTEGSNGTYTITVTNSGTTLTSSAMPVTVRDFLPQGFSYVSSSGVGWACSTASGIVTCSLGATTIAAGGNSQVTITVLPIAPAAANSPVTNSVQVFGGGDITQGNNFGQDTTNVNPAPAPVVDIAPPSKDFGSVGAGQTSAVQTFTLLNSGNGTLTVNGITKTGTDAGQFNLQLAPAFAAFTCPSVFPFNLTAGANCTFGVSFSPTGAGTGRSASISVTSNASTSPNLVPLSGTNVPLGTLTGSATAFNFGSVVVGQASGNQTFTLSNTGPGDLTVSALDVVGNAANSDDFMPGPATTCNVDDEPFVPFPLASGASCIIELAFTPTALGLRELTATFSATNSTVASVAVTLSGTGLGGTNTFTNGGGDGLWQNDLNWSLGHVPNAADTAVVDGVAANSSNPTLSAGAQTILALSMLNNTTLTISAGSLTFSAGSTATNLTINGGTLTASAALAISGALSLSAGGTLNGTGNVTLSSPLTWTGGTMSGTGTFTNNGAGANISGGTLDGKAFINSATGTATISAFSMANGAAFNNAGTINAQADGLGIGISAGAGATLTNTGTFTRSVGAGTYSIVGITFNNSGTINVNTGTLQLSNAAAPVVVASFTQTGGLTQVNTTFATGPTLNIQGGTLGGIGTVTPAPGGGAGGVNNSGGIVAPGLSPAIFAVSPSYTQGAGGALNIEIGGTTVGTDYDQLNAGGAPGTAALAGTLNLTLINGFVPVLGNSFTIVTSGPGATTGTFATVNTAAAPLSAGLFWRTTYNATSVVLDVVTATLTLAPDPLDFGNQKVGTTSGAQVATVTNTGGAAATLAAANAVTLGGTNAADFAITGGTCANNTVLAAAPGPGNTCTVNLTFTPGALGGRAATVTVTSNASNSPTSSALSGTGVLANVTVTPNPVNFGSIALTTTSAASTITVTNTGTLAATLAAVNPVTITGAQAGDFAIVGGTTTCLANVVLAAGGGSCVVNVTFTPGALGVRNATVNVFDDAPGSPQQTALTGTGVQSAITLNPSPVNFGNQRVLTTSAAMTVTVTNTGTLAATLDAADSVTIIGANAGDFAIVGGTTTCVDSFVLAANGGFCVVDITFTPSVTGARTATLNIADSDPNSPQQATLNGTGVLANVTLAPNPLDFGNQRRNVASAAQTITVTNSGNEASTLAAVTPVTITGANAGDFAVVGGTTTCVANFVLNANGGSCVINITFTPSVLGARTATVDVADDAPGSPQQATLNGTGVLPNVTLAPSPLNFADQKVATTSGAQTITVTNSGTQASALAAVSPVTITGANAGDFAIVGGTTTCVANFVLAAGGGSCVINITFTPGALGARTATVNLADDAPGSPQQATLNGTGVLANVTVTPNPVNFGSVALTVTSAASTITVTNTGTLAATLAAVNPVTITGADFAIVGGTTTCVAGFVLNAGGGSCVVNVTFTPTVLGVRNATLNVFDDAPASPQQTALTGTGVQSLITLNPSPVNFGNQKVLTTGGAMIVTVTNTGTLAATLDAADSVTIIGANAGDFAIVGGTTTCADNFVLAANGGSCIVDITFTPSVTGARTATLNIADSDPNSPQQAVLNGTGVLANVTVAPNPVAFAARIVNTTSAAMTVTVTNTGTLAATLAAANPVTITGAEAADFAIVGGTTTCIANFVLAAGGGSCVVDVTFTPGASGARAAILNVFDDAPASPQQTALTGTGQTPPTADLSTANISFGSQRVGTSTAATMVTLTNNGEATLAVESIVLGGADAAHFSIAPAGATPCNLAGGNVAGGGGSCAFSVTFSPTSTGLKNATITITDNANANGDPGTQQTITLDGTGIQANMTLTANPTAFGDQRVGTASVAMTVTVTNSGTDVATLAAANAVTITGANAADFANAGTGTCLNGLVLAISPGPGNTCTIDIIFTPSATGARAATVNVADDAPGSPQTAGLTGTGIQANITLAPNPADFGNVKVGTPSGPPPLTITVTNSGTDVATLAAANAVTITGANAAEFVNAGTGTCANGLVLAASPGPGNTCTVNIVFTPTALGARGPVTLNIADDAPGSPQTATLNGTGVLANLTLAPSPLNFGGLNLGSNVTMSITVTNTGTLAATLGAGTPVTISGADVGDFSVVAGTTCVASFVINAGGGSCIINVRFTPTALGARAAQVDVANDAPGNPHSVPLAGQGTQPGFNLSPTSVTTWPTVAEVQVGMTGTAAAITVTNPAGANAGPLTINSINDNSGDFSFVSNCPLAPATLAAGANCTITPSMSPQAGSVGPLAANISIVHDAAGSPGVISLSGTAVDFVLITTAPSATVTAGVSAAYTLNFDTAGGNSLFPTTFACAGLPRKAECIFNPSMIPAGSPDTTVTLTITTTSNTVTVSSAGVVPLALPTGGGLPPGGWLAIGMSVLGLFGLASLRRQALRLSAARLCLLGLLLVAGGYVAGCAGDGTGFPEGASGTPPGSYTVAVTATSGTVQRTTNITLNVQ